MNNEITLGQALDIAVEKQKKGRLQEAEDIYRNILEKYPESHNAFHLLGLIKYQKGCYGDAIEKIAKAIKIKPDVAIYHHNLGMVYDRLGNFKKSEEHFRKALEIRSDYPSAYLAYYNIAISLRDRGKFLEAIKYYDKTIELNPDFYDARWNRGLVLLFLGRFEQGWEEYEYRFKKESPIDPRIFNGMKWDGSFLSGKRILIVSEQGFGDNLQFLRYVPLVKEKGGYVILECKRELKRLFEDFLGVDEFVEKKDRLDCRYDYYIHLMSLPRLFDTNLENIPNKIPYLKAGFKLSEDLMKEFETEDFKVGISWAGNPNQANDKERSVDFNKFETLKIPGVKLFSLQKGRASEELEDNEIVNLDMYIDDFADTASIIDKLDLIISVDTSIVHLAGAMNKPVWVLLSHPFDWRWLLDRKDSPWYPSMTLFRQPKKGDWNSVFESVKKELEMLVKSKKRNG